MTTLHDTIAQSEIAGKEEVLSDANDVVSPSAATGPYPSAPLTPKERPMLFSGAMVRALLAGTKTQTRRIVKVQPSGSATINQDCETGGWGYHWYSTDERGDPTIEHWCDLRCPYGVPGDRLWIKETWQAQEAFNAMSPTAIGEAFAEEHGEPWCPIRYVADGKCEGSVEQWQESPLGKTRVSIHMPRWASRLTLEITDVRVERLQDISEADAIAEGVWNTHSADGLCTWTAPDVPPHLAYINSARYAYAELWERINGAGSWEANPWVWVVAFKVLDLSADGALGRHAPSSATPTVTPPILPGDFK